MKSKKVWALEVDQMMFTCPSGRCLMSVVFYKRLFHPIALSAVMLLPSQVRMVTR
jgi:hypothetical protein